jgi:hypothetical protein
MTDRNNDVGWLFDSWGKGDSGVEEMIFGTREETLEIKRRIMRKIVARTNPRKTRFRIDQN